MNNRTIHEVNAELIRWRVLALVSAAAFCVVALWGAVERVVGQ